MPLALLLLAIPLLLLSVYLAAVEAALGRMTRGRAADLRGEGRRNSAVLEELVQDLGLSVSVSTFVRLVAELTAGACLVLSLASVVASPWLVVLLGGAGLAVLMFVFVGLLPRTMGRLASDSIALSAAPTISRLVRLLGAPVRACVALVNLIVPGPGLAAGPFASDDDFIDYVEQAEADLLIERSESLMLQRVVRLGDTVAREVMVPRTDMLAVDAGTELEAVLRLHLRSGFSRIPVVGRDSDDVRGLSYLKDAAARLQDVRARAGSRAGTVDDVMRPVAFVPDSKAADALLADMQAGSVHLAVVVDEYGGVAGLVTIEDLLEEIVGQISDEYDREAPETEELEPGRWRVSARTHLLGLAEITGVDTEDHEVDTVAGLLAKELGRVPITGSTVEVGGLRLTADQRGRRNRLLTVLVEVLGSTDDDHGTRDSGSGRERRPTSGTGGGPVEVP